MFTNWLNWINKERNLDLNLLQWALPFFLSSTAIIFELVEHRTEESWVEAGFIGEMILFGFMGPIIIALILSWMKLLMKTEKQATNELQILNKALEDKVHERTSALETQNIALAKAYQELQQLDEMKSEFVSLVSHQLRAPLTTLNGGLELALNAEQNSATMNPLARRTLETMVNESARLTRYVQTILDISRMEAGKFEVNIGPVALRPLLIQAVDVIVNPSGRKIEWDIPTDIPPVMTDEIQLEEIIRNLLRNAVKYSPAEKPILIKVIVENDRIKISVIDHGPGVPEEQKQFIFERFTRVSSTYDSPPGWGLGLYFARKLVELQDGSIGLTTPAWPDPLAPGSDFHIILPISNTPDE